MRFWGPSLRKGKAFIDVVHYPNPNPKHMLSLIIGRSQSIGYVACGVHALRSLMVAFSTQCRPVFSTCSCRLNNQCKTLELPKLRPSRILSLLLRRKRCLRRTFMSLVVMLPLMHGSERLCWPASRPHHGSYSSSSWFIPREKLVVKSHSSQVFVC